MKNLRIFNSLNNKKEVFIPVDKNNIRIYACGPTVYDYAHIGNARMAVVFDFLVRLLRHIYPKVTYVSNITDIDDKIINRSIKEKKPFLEITEKYAKIYNEDMEKLNVMKPDYQPLATNFVKMMISKIKVLCEKKNAYFKDGHVLFDVSLFPKYGSLSKRNKYSQISGSRVKVENYKKNPEDFVLWKPSLKKEPGWNSPWGYGRPGWHTECFVMAEEILKIPFDIHGGGLDLKFPHHENEIAQSCCYNNNHNHIESYAKYWMHNGFVNIDQQKMSKSLGNIKLVKDYLKIYDGEIIRMALLSSHYRSPLNWTKRTLEQSKSILNKFYSFLLKINSNEIDSDLQSSIEIDEELIEPLLDDLNISKSLAYLNKKTSIDANIINKKEKNVLRKEIMLFGNLTGILQKNPNDWFKNIENQKGIDEKTIKKLIQERNNARQLKDYQKADIIRKKLYNMGIEIKDDKLGTTWKKTREIRNG